jgi:AAA domain
VPEDNISKQFGEPQASSNVEGLFSETISFLAQLRSNGPWVLTAIIPDGRTTTISARTTAEINAFVHENNGKLNLYYAVNPLRNLMWKKAAKTDVAAIEYLLADLDPAAGETPETAKARYLEQLNGSFEPKPTAIIDSGNGIQCLWRLTNPIVLPEEEAVRKAIIEDVETRSAALMVRLGAKPGTQNIDRILRLPGTTNLPNAKKRKEGRVECPTKLLSFNGASYPLELFPQPEQSKPGSPEDGGQHARQEYRDEAHEGENKLEWTIRTGGGNTFETRSHAVWYVICEMLRRKAPDSPIISTLLDKNNRISDHIYDQKDKDPRKYVDKQIAEAKAQTQPKQEPLPEVLDAGDDVELPPARGWLFGNIFARNFLSSLFGDGGVGKTALRYAQYMSLATGRNLTGEHIFQRCRVLIVSLEDDLDELRRRIWALRLHYKIPREELKGWLFLWAPGVHGGKLMELDKRGNPVVGKLRDKLKALITQYKADFVGIDPFVKTHGVGENNNVAIDMVVQVLVDLCHEMNIGADVPHHVSKAQKNDSEPGDANRGRGASAMKDAARLVYTLNVVTKDEAEKFGIKDEDRWAYVRMDKGKVNIVPPSRQAKWFHLIGVPIGNVSEMYPHGDNVQTVEPWDPPDVMGGMSDAEMEDILNRIEKGFPDGSRYTNSPSAKTRAAWKVVVEILPEKNEQQAREIIKTWTSKKILEHRTYQNPKTYKEEEGLWKSDVEIPF